MKVSQLKLNPVFTLQSIKSRIETKSRDLNRDKSILFLLYSPLNQGLKLTGKSIVCLYPIRFYSTVH